MIFEFNSYSKYLEHILEQRKAHNPRYSLRAMAKNFGVSASTLSDVINGRKNLSERTALKVASQLKMTGRKVRYFTMLVHWESTKDEELKAILANQLQLLNPRLRKQFEVEVERFKLIAEWYHIAILEMTYLNIEMTSENVADSLGITISQASEALQLLLKLDLLKETGLHRYEKTLKEIFFQSETANQALRKYHHQMLAKAQESLYSQSPAEKMVGSETFPMNVEDLPEAKAIIENCFQQILQLSKKSQNRSQVYHLGIQCFQLIKGKKK